MISPLIRKNLEFLRKCKKSRRQSKVIAGATDDQLLCLVEICLNILKGRVPLRKRQLRRLQTQAHLLRRLARTRSSRSARGMLQQQGNGLPAIAGMLASIVVPMIADALLHK